MSVSWLLTWFHKSSIGLRSELWEGYSRSSCYPALFKTSSLFGVTVLLDNLTESKVHPDSSWFQVKLKDLEVILHLYYPVYFLQLQPRAWCYHHRAWQPHLYSHKHVYCHSIQFYFSYYFIYFIYYFYMWITCTSVQLLNWWPWNLPVISRFTLEAL